VSDLEVTPDNIVGLTQQIKLAGEHVHAGRLRIADGKSADDQLALGNAITMLTIASALVLLLRVELTRDDNPFHWTGAN
jgi:hypothetical protein